MSATQFTEWWNHWKRRRTFAAFFEQIASLKFYSFAFEIFDCVHRAKCVHQAINRVRFHLGIFQMSKHIFIYLLSLLICFNIFFRRLFIASYWGSPEVARLNDPSNWKHFKWYHRTVISKRETLTSYVIWSEETLTYVLGRHAPEQKPPKHTKMAYKRYLLGLLGLKMMLWAMKCQHTSK